MSTKEQLAQYCADHFPVHSHNVMVHTATWTHDFILAGITILVGLGIGWYLKGRGWLGVKIDAGNAVTKVEAVGSEIKTEVGAL